MKPFYLLLRIIRHFLPDSIVSFLLSKQWIIKPGMETRAPSYAFERYKKALSDINFEINGKTAMIFGYGGNIQIACSFLDHGAKHVILLEREYFPEKKFHADDYKEFSGYFLNDNNTFFPNPEYISIIHQDINLLAASNSLIPVDIIVSSSVYEHLTAVENITKSLSQLTNPRGVNIHFIDLRDHFFRYPFEMLKYSETTWKRWLNPSSNLNRYRYDDYLKVFSKFFHSNKIIIEERDTAAYKKALPGIKEQFRTGDLEIDAVTKMHIIASDPKK